MKNHKLSRGWFVVALLVAIVLAQYSARLNPLQAELHWQSVLPTEENLDFVYSSRGGWVYCGAQQSSVWLQVPPGFTTEGGAEIHCDPSDSLLQWNNTADAWDDRGYLIGIYPSVSIVNPITLVFELDPTKTENLCETCLVGRYYQAQSTSWQKLSTDYDVSTMRATVEIAEVLSTSGYPAYEDRFIVALFVRSAPEKPAPSFTPQPSATFAPTSTPTKVSEPSSTLLPSATSTQTLKPSPTHTSQPSATFVSSSVPSPTQTPAPPPSNTPMPFSTSLPASSLATTSTPENSDGHSFPWWLVLGAFVAAAGGIILGPVLRKLQASSHVPAPDQISKGMLVTPDPRAERKSTAGNVRLVNRTSGQIIPVSDTVTVIGRKGILPIDANVSRKHARITRHDGYYWLEDLESLNGTFLNGVRVLEPVILTPGDIISVGQTYLYFEMPRV